MFAKHLGKVVHAMPTVYAYRIMVDAGFAPCYDNDLFTLACCKPIIRRTVGKKYMIGNYSRENPVWITAIGGSAYKGHQNDWIYVAKITDVVTYHEYFTNPKYRERKDCIYVIDNPKEFNGISHMNLRVRHNGTSPYHTEPQNWTDDWNGKDECYVLISDEFAYFTHEESMMLTARFPQFMASGRGHRVYEGSDVKELTDAFQILVNQGSKRTLSVDALSKMKEHQRRKC